ncbi:MAG TPA: alpha/beta hydrolase family protein [Gemmataceae bacterium]|nr:alpha/beta hydrolase family protein [Gemmataceae bacterium]
MSAGNKTSRRGFLGQAALASAGTALPWSAEAAVPTGQPETSPADPRRDLKPSRADLGSLFADVERLAGPEQYPLSFLSGRFLNLEEFRTTAREKVLELLQYRPPRVEPRAEVLERVNRPDHVRERIVFSTGPHFRVPAYVLIPRKLKGPAPAIVDLHSHGGMFLFGKEKVIDLGNNHPAMTSYHERNYDGRPTATALVRRGYVVITIDAFFFGERRLLLDADLRYGWDRSRYSLKDVQHLNQQCRAKETTLAKSLALAGLTWPGIVAWDDLRTVDYLVTRPEIDPKRIGCLGISMGGYRAMYLTALDERIRAGCVVGFMSTVRPMLRAHIDTHSWVHFLPELHRHLDWPDLASLAAPRALLVQQCSQDQLFPLGGMRAAVDRIAAVYAKGGVKGRFSGRFYDVPHRFTRTMQDEAFAWLDEQLGNVRR